MSETTPLERDRVLDPERFFADPAQIMHASGLGLAEKHEALVRWQFLVRRRLESGSEGMPTNGRAADDAELMQCIGKAILELEHRRGIDERNVRPAEPRNGAGTGKIGRDVPAGLHPGRYGPFDDPPRRPS